MRGCGPRRPSPPRRSSSARCRFSGSSSRRGTAGSNTRRCGRSAPSSIPRRDSGHGPTSCEASTPCCAKTSADPASGRTLAFRVSSGAVRGVSSARESAGIALQRSRVRIPYPPPLSTPHQTRRLFMLTGGSGPHAGAARHRLVSARRCPELPDCAGRCSKDRAKTYRPCTTLGGGRVRRRGVPGWRDP